MKKIVYIIIGAIASMVLFSCKQEILDTEAGQKEVVYDESSSLYGYAEGDGENDTKTYIGTITDEQGNEHKYAFWNEGEDIMCFVDGNEMEQGQIHKKYKYSSVKVWPNKTKALFCSKEGAPAANEKLIYAMYPYQEGAYLQCGNGDTVVVFNFPYIQKYKKGSFADEVNFAFAKVRQLSDTVQNADFKNLFGYLKLSLKCDNFPGEDSAPFRVKGIRIMGYTLEQLSGTFVAWAHEDIPFAMGATPGLDGQGNRLTRGDHDAELYLDCSGEPDGGVLLNSETAEDFWFVLPQYALYNGFHVSVICECGGTEDRVNVDIEANSEASLGGANIILRSVVKSMPAITVHNFPAEHFELLDYIESDGHRILNTGFIVNDGQHEGIGIAMRGQMLTQWCDWDTYENEVLKNEGYLMWDNAAFCGVVQRYDYNEAKQYRNWLTIDGLFGQRACRISYNNDNLFGNNPSQTYNSNKAEIGQGNFEVNYAFFKGGQQCYAVVNNTPCAFIGFKDVLTPPAKDNEDNSDTWGHPNREQFQQPYLYLFGVRCLKTRATAMTKFIEQGKRLSATYNKIDPYFKSRSRISYFKIYDHTDPNKASHLRATGSLDRDPIRNWIPVKLKEALTLVNYETGTSQNFSKGTKGLYDYVNNTFWCPDANANTRGHFRYSGDAYFVWEREPVSLY